MRKRWSFPASAPESVGGILYAFLMGYAAIDALREEVAGSNPGPRY
jgi:hypothetical protein